MTATELTLIVATTVNILVISILTVATGGLFVELAKGTPGAGLLLVISLIGLAISGVVLYLISDLLAEA